MLTKEQILDIPKLRETLSIKEVALKYGVTSRAIDYQIQKLNALGIKVPSVRGRRRVKLQ